MKRLIAQFGFVLPLLFALSGFQPKTVLAQSRWIHFDHSGRLKYRHLKKGDRILDFSYAGYRGGGIALPDVPVQRTVAPSGDDDSLAIQVAIDQVSELKPVNGFRGAVLLSAGHFKCKLPLKINTSGV